MKSTIFFLILMGALSCSAPKPIIFSSDILPACHCEGNGKYTLVMDAGMGNWSILYKPAFEILKKDYKVCLIDRSGYNMEKVTSNPRDLKTVATELNNVLTREGVTDNLILIGHSLGGLHVRMYQSQYPESVEGLVLLDAAHSDQFNRLPNAFYELMKNQPKQLEEVIPIAQKGYLKYSKKKIPTFGLPAHLLEEYYTVATEPEYYYTMKNEVEAFEANLITAKTLNTIHDLPLLVIGSKNSMDKGILPAKSKEYPYDEHNGEWFKLQQDLASLSTNSTFVESEANHYLNVTDADLVCSSISNWITINFSDYEN